VLPFPLAFHFCARASRHFFLRRAAKSTIRRGSRGATPPRVATRWRADPCKQAGNAHRVTYSIAKRPSKVTRILRFSAFFRTGFMLSGWRQRAPFSCTMSALVALATLPAQPPCVLGQVLQPQHPLQVIRFRRRHGRQRNTAVHAPLEPDLPVDPPEPMARIDLLRTAFLLHVPALRRQWGQIILLGIASDV
jgi:hypothetical protein